MQIIISPAKRMVVDTDSLDILEMPQFLAEAEVLKNCLQAMGRKELQTLWHCSDAIAAENVERLSRMDLERSLSPAILSYQGIQYQYMAPGVFEEGQFAFLHRHLRILSGFYGVLRPFDGVVPYRLEMQAKLPVAEAKNLYAYWGPKLAQSLAGEGDCILNLASKEYSRAVLSHLPKGVQVLTCSFGELQRGGVVEKGTLCKMARGQMVRFLAENNITHPGDVLRFDSLGYTYRPELSTSGHAVFIKEGRFSSPAAGRSPLECK